jgi:hypothetical protein
MDISEQSVGANNDIQLQVEPKFHPAAEVFPLLDGADFDALVRDIQANGLRETIVMLDGSVLDGRNRYRACLKAGMQPSFEEWKPRQEGDTPIAFVVSKNLVRRHLNESQRAMLGARLVPLFQPEARDRMSAGKAVPSANLRLGPLVSERKSTHKAGALVNVSARSVETAYSVIMEARPSWFPPSIAAQSGFQPQQPYCSCRGANRREWLLPKSQSWRRCAQSKPYV